MNNEEAKPARKRSLTEMTLTWLADKLRRSESLREQIEAGEYNVESEKLARALVNQDSSAPS